MHAGRGKSSCKLCSGYGGVLKQNRAMGGRPLSLYVLEAVDSRCVVLCAFNSDGLSGWGSKRIWKSERHGSVDWVLEGICGLDRKSKSNQPRY